MIKFFSELSLHDTEIAGGKGASLGEMTQAGIPVPPGFVLLSNAFEEFLHANDLYQEIDAELYTCDKEKMHTIEHASERIQGMILSKKIPEDMAKCLKESFQKLDTKFVAVRSSATVEDSQSAAWAGQLDSFLNTTEESLLENVKRCWASLFTPRAIFYRMEQGLQESKVSVAVVVQTMIQSEVSGIAFSVHPVTEDPDQLIIEAGYGLGEAIVSGSITPDAYVVSKKNMTLLDKNIAHQEKMLVRFSSNCLPLEKGVPSLRGEGFSGLINSENQSGKSLCPEDGTSPFSKGRQPEKCETNTKSEILSNHWISVPSKDRSRQKLTDSQIFELSEIIKQIESHYGFPCDIEWAFAHPASGQGEGRFFVVQSRPITTLKKIADADFSMDEMQIPKLSEYQKLFQWNGNFSYFLNSFFMGVYEKLEVLSFYDGVMWQSYIPLSVKINTLSEGVTLYGDKKSYSKIKNGLFDEYKILESLFKENLKKTILSRDDVANCFEESVKYYGHYSKTEFFYTDKAFQEQERNPEIKNNFLSFDSLKMTGRNQLNQLCLIPNNYLDRLLQKIGKQFEIDLYLLKNYTMREIISLFETASEIPQEVLLERECAYFSKGKGSYFESVFSSQAKEFANNFLKELKFHHDLSGQVANGRGKTIGIVRVLTLSIEEIEKTSKMIDEMKKGEILVADTTAPEIVIACKKAIAIVTNQGGMLSHAAIISRELGIPCIVGTGYATQVLHDGDLVEVDANEGVVRILERAGRHGGSNREEDKLITISEQKKIFENKNIFVKDDYLLSFWAHGVSVFVTDIHFEVYRDLETLFIIDHGLFKQYFTKKAYNLAQEKGLEFYGDPNAFKKYKKGLKQVCKEIEIFFEQTVKGKEEITSDQVILFFEYIKKLCGDYAKMNFEYTDKAFLFQEKNPFIKKNLSEVSLFKDSVRTVMNSVLFDEEGYVNQLFNLLGRQFNVSSSVFQYLTQREILSFFDGVILKELSVKKRQNAFVQSCLLLKTYEGKVAKEIVEIFQEKVKDGDVIMGKIANKGKIRGRVKVIPVNYSDFSLMKSEMEKMEKESVLIAETTAPELIVACKKASAIVTAVGGLMSHAAIISREFNIPCIVGVENITKILFDGDLVEVDANAGVVRILERAKKE